MDPDSKNNDNEEKSWFSKKENWWIICGFVVALGAVAVPFIIMLVANKRFDVNDFKDLGTVGDYFGGTTVGLLSLASIIFVTAAIIMQKEELALQRDEVKKTREEYEITNSTMKKQQFDSTFFNMINLHHNILSEINYKDKKGREAIKVFYEELRDYYDTEIYENYSKGLKERALVDNKKALDELVRKVYIDHHLNNFIREFEENNPIFPSFDESNSPETSRHDSFYVSMEQGTNKLWNKEEQEHILRFNENILFNKVEYLKWLEALNLKESYEASVSNMYVEKYLNEFVENPLKELKVYAFQKVYEKNESLLGHYFRNLYRIVKLIQDEEFNKAPFKDNNEKRKYRGILRAQLSSYELIMLFYNIVYSYKGEKFQLLIKNTNFFDDHLVTSDFIWRNDVHELENLDPF
ncbi:putative phage abortive infection protein [Paenibacillus donghaensis]|uniref:Phage abortive infection protein n=1 Tax=Paenibacillus donghaensis TaxID=414771 RepID=A0A2Z2KS85_9BACL|nr:putative phage abortive infection protein [Paenibacillus donghaensis]ASA23421.1 hypothetical protein B9T62_23010 [Paenibacillus donghaensis]